MKVRCVSLPVVAEGLPPSDAWVQVGSVYDVGSAHLDGRGRLWLLLILPGEDGLGWFPIHDFTTVDDRIPPQWVVRIDDLGALDLGPAAWLEPGLWERYYDGDPGAQLIIEREIRHMSSARFRR